MEEKLDQDKLSSLYALAKKAVSDPWNDMEYTAEASPDIVIAIIDRVRELEGENNMLRPALEQCEIFISSMEKELGREMLSGISARAALERSEILNKE